MKRAPRREPIPTAAECDVVARTGCLLRLRSRRARGGLFDDPLAGLGAQIGGVLLVDVHYDDGGETIAADVIGAPAIGVVELRTRGELDGRPKVVTIRSAPIARREALW